MTKTIVITQSNYIPWRGYFDLLRSADEVVLLDSVQYTRRDWRNRNQIKTANGPVWLTISVEAKGRYHQTIDETRVADPGWSAAHRRAIETAYRRAPYYSTVGPWFLDLLDSVASEALLTSVNERLLRAVCDRLGITAPVRRCTDVMDRALLQSLEPTERLAALAQALGATRYLSGPAAQAYLDTRVFTDRGIEVGWMTYAGYPDYPQLWGGFEPRVSIVDLLLNTGDEAPRYLDRTAS